MKKYIILSLIACSLAVQAQNRGLEPETATPSPTIFKSVKKTFDLSGTKNDLNSDVTLSTAFIWNTVDETPGAMAKLDYWITKQQGLWFDYQEFAQTRTTYIGIGYQARTVVKGFELSLGVGVRQDTDEHFGNVDLVLTPTITKSLVRNSRWDVSAVCGCDVLTVNSGKPNPFAGIRVRLLK